METRVKHKKPLLYQWLKQRKVGKTCCKNDNDNDYDDDDDNDDEYKSI